MKVKVNGREIEAEPQRIETIVNKYTDIYLEDGIIVRIRVEVGEVLRNVEDPDDYVVRCKGNVVNIDKSQVDVKRFLNS